MPSFTIDSNIIIYHLKEDPAVTTTLERWLLKGDHLFVSTITRIEVLAAPVLREGEEIKIQKLLDKFLHVPVDVQIANLAARIRRMHRLALGDSIIAATALFANSTLVTRNIRDFKKVSALNLYPL